MMSFLLQVYYISKGNLKPANKKYSSINNDYELTFSHETTIELVSDDG
jgi:replication factor A1